MTKTLRHITLILACVTMCAGCMSTKSGTDFDSANVSKLKVGETTEKEVIELFGQPRNRTRNSDGTVILQYAFYPGGTITGIPMLTFKNKGEQKTLMVVLDASGKVKSFSENSSQ